MSARTFALPDLGEGLEEATVATWLVARGDEVELNQPLAEIETAKATVELPSPYAGRVTRIHVPAGATLRVGESLITIVVEADGDVEADETLGDGAVSTAERATGREGVLAMTDEGSASRGPAPATPAVRALARERGVDLSGMTGSGPDGRITREDVDRAAGDVEARRLGDRDTEERPLTPLRRVAADRLSSAAAVPTVTTWRTVDCSALERVRADGALSPLPFVVRALADVCGRHPAMNASWTDDAILLHGRVHVGIATDTARGLLVPVVRDADRLGIAALAARIAELATTARDGTIAPDDMAGHTITVTNTGSYGSEAGTPLLNPPDAVIVALGIIALRPLVADGGVVARPACTLSVTFDHRVLDGATVGRALNDLVAILQDERALRALPT